MGGSAPLKTPLFCDMIFQNVLIGLRHSYDKWVFVDFHMLCVFTVGEAFMPPVHMVRFRRNAEKTGTFHRREA